MEFKKENQRPNYSELIDLINAAWPEEFGLLTEEEKIEEMEKSHNNETDTVKYLYEKEKLIGFYRYSLWPREDKGTKKAHTYDVSILPEYQKKGYGTEIMKDMIKECKKDGIEKLLSRSFKNNEGSIKLHKRIGFKLHLETEDSLVWEIDIK
jgi:RimJ/RimL family protein N-acetyltransferase